MLQIYSIEINCKITFMLYITDYHIHTNYSDGTAEPEEYISTAIKKGFKEIGFSEHLNLFRTDLTWCIDMQKVPDYISHISSLKNQLDNIKIKTGFEIDYYPGKEKEINDIISSLNIDYAIGSIHFIGENTVDSSEDFYNGKSFNDIFVHYFEIVFEAIKSGLFDFIAHCDLIRIFGLKYQGNPEPLYRHLAHLMAKHEVALEINTNGKNKPLGEFYPDVRFLHLFKKENVPVCVNSDAHNPGRIGEYFSEAYQLLKDAGYTEMCTFNRRERYMIPADFSLLST